MKKTLNITSAFFFIVVIGLISVSGQLPIKVPKIPKTEKPKAEKPTQEQPNSNNGGSNPVTNTAKTDSKHLYPNQTPNSTPILLKNTVYVQTRVHNSYWKLPKESNYSSWVPMIRFSSFFDNQRKLNYTVEYFNPNGSPWYSEKLEQGTQAADRTVMFQSPNPYDILNAKSTDGAGVYSFKITDEDTKEVVYQGKFKVGKVSRASRPQEKNKNDFFVEHDWLLPFGIIGFHHSDIEIGGVPPEISVWLNGSITADELEGRLFYNEKQLFSTKERGGVTDYDTRTSEYAAAFAPHTIWKRWQFTFRDFLVDNNGSFNRDRFPNAHYADKNPGEYSLKIYHKGTHIREMNFSVGADGKFAVPSYTNQFFMPYHRLLLPVKVIGKPEKVNPAAWKADSFYGNPVSGFTEQ